MFFVAIIYTFVTKELLPKNINHKVSFDGVTFIKNGYADLTAIENRQNFEDEHAKNFQANDKTQSCQIDLINLSDGLSYATTNNFSIKAIIKTPERIASENSDETTLPSSSLKDTYKLRISCENKVIEEFPLGKLEEILNLKEKKTTDAEKRDMKVVSKDKRIVMFVNFTVD